MQSKQTAVNFYFFILLFFMILYESCGIISADESYIAQVQKREPKSELVKNYCLIPSLESGNYNSKDQTMVECSKVSGPFIKLEVGDDNYLKLDAGHFVAPSEYCVLHRSHYGKLCPSNSDPLWKKCCGEDELLDMATFKCRKSRLKFRPKVQDSLQSFTVPLKENATGDLVKPLACPTGFVSRVFSTNPCLPKSSGNYYLAPNGTPMYHASTGVFLRKTRLKPVEHDLYCVDGLADLSSCNHYDEELDQDGGEGNAKCQRGMGTVLLVCMEDFETFVNEGNEKGVPKVYFLAAIWLSTCPLLLSAAVVNSCIIRKNVHDCILTSYLISMFLVNINSVVLILEVGSSSSSSFSSFDGCGVFDFSMKFIYMSTLCWMTSMNFGLWRTFSSAVPQVVGPQRFILSALFSLGFPVIPVVVSYYIGSLPDTFTNNSPMDYSESSATTSGDYDGESSNGGDVAASCHQKGACALYSYKTLPYYSGPIIFLVSCNLVVFLKTSTTIASLRRQAEAVLHKQTKDHMESFTLFAKLFLLSGSIWVIRVVLLVLQTQSLYLTWYGVVLEAMFSIPEVVFPMIIFHHPEFIKWAWRKSPVISQVVVKCNPFWKRDLLKEMNSLELQSANQISVQRSQAVHNEAPTV